MISLYNFPVLLLLSVDKRLSFVYYDCCLAFWVTETSPICQQTKRRKKPHIDGGSPSPHKYATCRIERPHRTIIPACKRDKSISAKEKAGGKVKLNLKGDPSFSHRTDQKCKCQPVRNTDTYTDRDTDRHTDRDTVRHGLVRAG